MAEACKQMFLSCYASAITDLHKILLYFSVAAGVTLKRWSGTPHDRWFNKHRHISHGQIRYSPYFRMKIMFPNFNQNVNSPRNKLVLMFAKKKRNFSGLKHLKEKKNFQKVTMWFIIHQGYSTRTRETFI